MQQDILLRIVLGAILLSVIGIRIYYMKSMQLPSQAQPEKGKKNIVVPMFAMPCGAILGVVAALLLLWVHHALGKNFSPRVRIRQQHALCTSGPYKWIRHPMYTILYMLSIAWLIALANWLVGLFWLTLQTIVIATRIHKEAAVLIEHFGDEYRAYMLKTGRFLPRLRQPG